MNVSLKECNNSNENDSFCMDFNYIKSIINAILKESEKLLILSTGSTGRCEEYSKLDDIELLLYDFGNIELANNLIQTIETYSKNCRIILERKSTYYPDHYEGENGNLNIFFPSRHIDNILVYGSEEKLTILDKIFIKNILSMKGKYIGNWKGRIKYHKKISEKGIGDYKKETFALFNIDRKTLFYKKNPNTAEVSIKIGPLRYIQYSLIFIIIKLIRNKKININNFNDIGKSVTDKLDFISDLKGSPSFIEIEKIKSLYTFFLGIHNKMCSKFNKRGEGIIQLSDNEFKLFLENLEEFNNLVKMLPINYY